MAATMLARFVHQTTRLTNVALRQRTFAANYLRPFSSSASLLANRLFTEKHEWILMEGTTGTVGISDHAQDSLGEIVYVGLPEVGTEVEKEGEAGVVESVKAASDIFSPVAGIITAVNDALTDSPDLINKSPQDEGWLFKLEVGNMEELKSLMDEAAYKKFVADAE